MDLHHLGWIWWMKSILVESQCFPIMFLFMHLGFPDSSVGKESACNAGDPGSIPRSGRSAGEGTGYPLQYSWASLVAQLVKNPPAVWEIWVWSLGWGDPLEKGKATHSSILAWRIPRTVWSRSSERVRHHWVTFPFIFSTSRLNRSCTIIYMLCIIYSCCVSFTHTYENLQHTKKF